MNKLILALSTLLPTVALAHEEHGSSLLTNLWHVLASPEHAWPLTIAVLLVAIVCWFKIRS